MTMSPRKESQVGGNVRNVRVLSFDFTSTAWVALAYTRNIIVLQTAQPVGKLYCSTIAHFFTD